jgi:hypothetical protein
MTNHTQFTYIGEYDSFEIEYEPMYYLSSLGWFNIAKCARARMTEHCHNLTRWQGERRSFYSSIQAMDADTDEEYMQQVIKEWERIDDDPELTLL